MGNELAGCIEQNDVSLGDFPGAGTFDHKHIVWPDSGQHAPPHNPQTERARRAQQLARQFVLEGMRLLG